MAGVPNMDVAMVRLYYSGLNSRKLAFDSQLLRSLCVYLEHVENDAAEHGKISAVMVPGHAPVKPNWPPGRQSLIMQQ